MKKVLVVAGPTAVGKSDFAVRLAKKFNADIISGDSIQVYRGLDIGSGKVTENEKQGVTHYLIDILDSKDSYSVADFQKMARQIIDTSDRRCIICGGTGLYLKACLYDYDFEEEDHELSVDPELESYTNDQLYAMLKKSDPVQAEKIHKNNRRRLLRSLTIQRHTGRIQSDIEKEQSHRPIYDIFIVGCTMDREKLYDRINRRVEGMMQQGLEEEIDTLLVHGVTFEDACMKGIGYKEWRPYFEGTMEKEQVVAEIQKHSRQFAKRQYTWFNHQLPMHWCDMTNEKEVESMIETIQQWYEGEIL